MACSGLEALTNLQLRLSCRKMSQGFWPQPPGPPIENLKAVDDHDPNKMTQGYEFSLDETEIETWHVDPRNPGWRRGAEGSSKIFQAVRCL